MPSVVALLEQRELVARRRVDELREEADRIQAELAVAERDWKEWAIARSRVGEVLAPADETGHGHDQADRTAPTTDGQAEEASSTPQAAKTKAQVPVWREGLAWSVLSVDYQRILTALVAGAAGNWLRPDAPTSVFTGPSAHSTASVSSKRASARA